MSLNWREIDLVLAELNLEGSHIQQILQPDFRNLALQIYRPGDVFWLRVCLETGKTRLHRSTKSVRKPKTRQRFVQLLQARIKGGKIITARQVGSERIVQLTVHTAGQETTLWVRLWGGAANIIATDPDGTIVDAFFRRPKRGEVSGERFSPPDPGDREPKPFEPRFHARPDEDGGSVNAQIEEHYAELADDEETTRLLDVVTRALNDRQRRLEDQLERAEARLQEAGSADRMQLFGDLIRSNMHAISSGDTMLETTDYTRDNTPITIELDTSMSALANAERYYDRAKRAKRKAGALKDEARNLRNRITTTENQLADLPEIDLEELRELAGDLRGTQQGKPQRGPAIPGLQFESGGFTILVGRGARENDTLLRHHVRGNDVWLHTRDHPGGYVFVRSKKNKSVPLEVLLDAGNLAVHYSKARANGRAELYYTQVKYLRRAKDGPPGLVLPTHEKNLSIVIEPQRLERLHG